MPTSGEPRTPPGRATRELLSRAEAIATELTPGGDPAGEALGHLRRRVDAMVRELGMARLAEIELDRLRDVAPGGLLLGPLERAGVATVADVLLDPDLERHHGVGAATAREARGAALQVEALARASVRFRFDVEAKPSSHTAVLRAAELHLRASREAPLVEPVAEEWAAALRAPLAAARPATKRFRLVLASRDRRVAARQAVARVEQLLAAPDLPSLRERVSWLRRPDDADPWAWFQRDAATVHAHLDAHTDARLGADQEGGHLPAEIIAAVRRQPLDTGHLTVSLRGYQSFGARYALVQEHALLGDEMGLGKTVTALAAAGHLAASGRGHVLVVCPATVLHSWLREVHTHTELAAWLLHGDGRHDALADWREHSGIGVTTFGTLGSLGDALPCDLLVVDEAHLVKNRDTNRARQVGRWRGEADRVLYMTGTPLENDVDEFRSLVAQLQPDLADRLGDAVALSGTDGFAGLVAPVYLRRNQDDVLTELPGRLEADDWVRLSADDEDNYRRAVAERNLMAMRRAAWEAAGTGDCSKMARLAEIVDESAAEGWKVVVFSFFLDTLDRIAEGLHLPVVGPLTGAVPPGQRQRLVDDFTAHDGPAVLVAQVAAGGVGLNIQAASVVVLAEPQWKPSVEEQAIARCLRMGQTRRVHVHRLLAEPGIDQRMVELLAAKEAVFDTYARRSSIAEEAADAKDRSHVSMGQQILHEELVRLGLADDVAPSDVNGSPDHVK